MTLDQWLEESGNYVGESNGCKFVNDDFPPSYPNECRYRAELFRLRDYVVSSVTAGTIWLVPRRFSHWIPPA